MNFAKKYLPPSTLESSPSDVWSTDTNLEKTSIATFLATKAQAIRITQKAESGSSGRPHRHLMWVEQVEQVKQVELTK